jgi:hypothetical protein
MFNARYAHTDPDIDPERIRSRIMRGMLGQYDAYCTEPGDSEITFLDPYGSFMFAMLDTAAEYKLDIMDYMGEEYDPLSERMTTYHRCKPVELPTFRLIYVVPYRRGRGLQTKILNEIKSKADELGESFAIFAGPIKLNGQGREVNILQSLQKLETHGYTEANDYHYQLYKQRKRFLDLGFKNVKYHDARLTGPWQSFVYVHANAPEAEVELFRELEVHYVCPKYETPEQSD